MLFCLHSKKVVCMCFGYKETGFHSFGYDDDNFYYSSNICFIYTFVIYGTFVIHDWNPLPFQKLFMRVYMKRCRKETKYVKDTRLYTYKRFHFHFYERWDGRYAFWVWKREITVGVSVKMHFSGCISCINNSSLRCYHVHRDIHSFALF